MTPAQLEGWMDRQGLNRSKAAVAIGISRTTLQTYLKGKYPIPLYIALACAAIERGLPPE